MNLIDKILTEWSYRVYDGMPDIKNLISELSSITKTSFAIVFWYRYFYFCPFINCIKIN